MAGDQDANNARKSPFRLCASSSSPRWDWQENRQGKPCRAPLDSGELVTEESERPADAVLPKPLGATALLACIAELPPQERSKLQLGEALSIRKAVNPAYLSSGPEVRILILLEAVQYVRIWPGAPRHGARRALLAGASSCEIGSSVP